MTYGTNATRSYVDAVTVQYTHSTWMYPLGLLSAVLGATEHLSPTTLPPCFATELTDKPAHNIPTTDIGYRHSKTCRCQQFLCIVSVQGEIFME